MALPSRVLCYAAWGTSMACACSRVDSCHCDDGDADKQHCDIVAGIMAKVESDFRIQQRFKDATSRTLENRLRTARYLGASSSSCPPLS